MTFTRISSAARRSLLGAVVALALAAAFFAAASPAKASTGSPIGKLDNAGGYATWDYLGRNIVSGWAADPDVALYSPIDVRLDLYRYDTVCYFRGCVTRASLVSSLTQTAYDWNSDAMWALGGLAGAHGFRFALDYGFDYAGVRQACVTALNVGPGSDTPLGCVATAWIG